jgi:hypothetical protein
LEGPEAQAAEWKTLTDEFWRHVDLQVGEVALTQKFTDYDEERRQVVLRIEAQIVAGNVSLPPLAL